MSAVSRCWVPVQCLTYRIYVDLFESYYRKFMVSYPLYSTIKIKFFDSSEVSNPEKIKDIDILTVF